MTDGDAKSLRRRRRERLLAALACRRLGWKDEQEYHLRIAKRIKGQLRLARRA